MMKPRRERRKIEVEEIDITSLLDILVILLVFLLMSFSSSELRIDFINNLTLPYSNIKGLAHHGAVIQINALKEVMINSSPIGFLDDTSTIDKKIVDALKALPDDPKGKAKDGVKTLSVLIDKNLEYRLVQIILQSADEAGFGKYKLIVQGKP